jgi:hypothetical protein
MTSRAKPFRFESSGLLRDEFHEAAAAQLQAVALAAVKPATEQHGKYLVQTLRPVVVRLKRIIVGWLRSDGTLPLRNTPEVRDGSLG